MPDRKKWDSVIARFVKTYPLLAETTRCPKIDLACLSLFGLSSAVRHCLATMEQRNLMVGAHRRRRRMFASPCWSRAVQAGLVGVLGSVSCRRVGAALSEG